MAFGVIAAVTSVVATGASLVAGRKAGKSQQLANEAQQKINRLKNAQQMRLFRNRVRGFLAETVISGQQALAGGFESSRIQGTLSSEKTQRDLAIKEYNELDALGGEYTASMNRAARQSFQAQTYGQAGGFAGDLGGYDKLSDWLTPGSTET